uniref:Uncharacterized protein n=1 Tax=Anopheles quadriannulatus TaxID=34691 RepID=A0A182XTR6_ANOQN
MCVCVSSVYLNALRTFPSMYKVWLLKRHGFTSPRLFCW